ncbi:MAG: hypothetical protein NT003_02660 [Candidatus Magasanikbacteria bacterium]|nr:hypothetical protein [Candidatus Magasanikbacteria bacterium]
MKHPDATPITDHIVNEAESPENLHRDTLANSLKTGMGVAQALERINNALKTNENDTFDERGRLKLSPTFISFDALFTARKNLDRGHFDWKKMLSEWNSSASLKKLIRVAEEELIELSSVLDEYDDDTDGTNFQTLFDSAQAAAQKSYAQSTHHPQYDERTDLLHPDPEFVPSINKTAQQLFAQARHMRQIILDVLPQAKEKLATALLREADETATATTAAEQKNQEIKNNTVAEMKNALDSFLESLNNASEEADRMNEAYRQFQDDEKFFNKHGSIGHNYMTGSNFKSWDRKIMSGSLVFDTSGRLIEFKRGVGATEVEVAKMKQQLVARKNELRLQLGGQYKQARSALDKVNALEMRATVDAETRYLAGDPHLKVLQKIEKIEL